MAAAKRLFPLQGFEGVSMDAIAAEAGVSKLTVYSHFTDKETLFMEAVKEKCLEQVPDDIFLPVTRGPIRAALMKIARHFHDLISSDEAVGLHRMLLADRRNAETLGRMFWEAGPARVTDSLERFLRASVERGQLDIPDAREAAGHFLCLLKGEVNRRMLCGAAACAHGDDVEAHVGSVVDFFLRAYAPR
jgi:TetR/AcrR family transcriptional repressor of mexJK operon